MITVLTVLMTVLMTVVTVLTSTFAVLMEHPRKLRALSDVNASCPGKEGATLGLTVDDSRTDR